MTINIIKSNPELNNAFRRIRNRRRLQQTLEENNINVETTVEKQESEESKEEKDFEQQASSLGIGIQETGVDKSIQDAQEMMDIAGVGKGQTVGEVARDIAQQNRTFADPYAEAFTSMGGTKGIAAKAGLATYGAVLAGQMEVAKGLYTGAKALSGPASIALDVIGPTEMYGDVPVAMGSGVLGAVSSKVMDIHYGVADKMSQGIAGYNQGVINGQVISLSPGFFGGKVLTGNVPPGLTASMFEDIMEQQKEYAEKVEPFGGVGATNVISDPSTISVDTFDSATEAAKAGVGYSSYDAQGNPTGAAPAGSQYSATGVFSTGDDNNDSDDNNSSGGNAGDPGGGVDGPGGEDSSDSEMGGEDVAYGGKIGMRMGGDPVQQQAPSTKMGFIGGPPDQFTEQQTIADDIPKEVPEGTFVINAPAVEFAGKEDIKQMLVEAYEIIAQADTDAGLDKSPRAAKIPSKEQVDIMISRGEVIVPPEIAKVIGYDRLEKINNRGKKEVARRQEESQQQEKPQARQVAEGGFINTDDKIASADYSEGGIDTLRATLLRATGHLDNIEQGLGEGFKYGKKSREGDTLRHILTSGYISEDGFLNNFMSDLFDNREKSENMSEEDKIDLNNNKFGRLLRQKYPDRVEFTKQARNVVDKLIKGETVEIDGVSPMMSVRAE